MEKKDQKISVDRGSKRSFEGTWCFSWGGQNNGPQEKHHENLKLTTSSFCKFKQYPKRHIWKSQTFFFRGGFFDFLLQKMDCKIAKKSEIPMNAKAIAYLKM